ncbi:MAG: trigger factor [Vulcanimicrobiaceae bacterium]
MSTAAIVKHLDPTQVELEIAISDEELAVARERAFKTLVKNVRIPGFRPGKAPRRVFEAQYGTAGIEERAMDAVVPDAYSRALQENDLDPVDQPQMELMPVEAGQPLRVRATVSVRPAFALQSYEGIALEAASTTVSDEELETALQALRKDQGTLVPVDRPVTLGDTPTIDYEGKIDGVPFEGGKAEGQPTEILSERFIPGFASGIVGMKAGETKEVDAHFPPDYGSAELAGKTAVFTITVHENKATELPELDDEFAKRFGREDGTLASLRDELRNRLEAQKREQQRRTLTGPLLEKLMAMHDFALPAVLVERETENLANQAKGYIEQAGVTWDDYLEKQGKTQDELTAEYRVEAEKRVKGSLIIEAIAKAEHVQATNADIEAEIAQLSRQYQQPREAILEMLRSNFNALVDGIVRTKTVELILDRAVLTEVPSLVAEAPPSASEATSSAATDASGEATIASPA